MPEQDNPYTIDYFINKFAKIPCELWTTYNFHLGNQCCALGHCGAYFNHDADKLIWNSESQALKGIFSRAELPAVQKVNDCVFDREFTQKHPKGRILHALKLAKEKEQTNV